MVPFVPSKKGNMDFSLALSKDHRAFLPFVMSPQSLEMASSISSSSSEDSSSILKIAHTFAKSLVPRAEKRDERMKQRVMELIRVRPIVKCGAFRRPLGSLFSSKGT